MEANIPPSSDEIAFGHGVGVDSSVLRQHLLARARARHVDLTPQQALIEACAPTGSTRTLVEFSGGVDSSLILSAATRASAKVGAAPPRPITLRFRDASTDERDFQERMVEWLGLGDWTIIDVDDELDLVGPAAASDLRRDGLAYAARIAGRSWWLDQVAQHVEPGTRLLSGEGGDEVLGPAPHAARHAVRYAASTGTFRRQALAVARHRIGHLLRPSSHRPEHPRWLTELGRHRHVAAWKADRATGRSMSDFVLAYRSTVPLVDTQRRLRAQAARFELDYRSPLLDHDVLAVFHRDIAEHHHINRSMVIQRHFADLLPAALTHRTSKVYFGEAVFNRHTQRFAAGWDGVSGVPCNLVRPEVLRSSWRSDHDARSGLLLQSAWLATNT